MSVDHYEVLGVRPDADKESIKRAWMGLIRKLHPDMNPDGGDPALFQQVQTAYEVLSNPESRAEFDRSRPKPGQPKDPFDVPRTTTRPRRQRQPSPPRTEPTEPFNRSDPFDVPRPSTPAKGSQNPDDPDWVAFPKRPVRVHRAPRTSPRATTTARGSTWRLKVPTDLKAKVTPSPASMLVPPLVGMLVFVVACVLLMKHPESPNAAASITTGGLVPAVGLFAAGYVLSAWYRMRLGYLVPAYTAMSLVLPGLISLVAYMASDSSVTAPGFVAAGALFATMMTASSALKYVYVKSRVLSYKTLRDGIVFGSPAKPNTQENLVNTRTAEELRDLTRIPSVRIYHSLLTPSTPADTKAGTDLRSTKGMRAMPGLEVDHAVVAGHHVALVQSRIWPAGTYTVDPYGYLRVDGHSSSHSLLTFTDIQERWQKLLGRRVHVKVFVAVHSDGPCSSDIDSSGVEIVPADRVVDAVGEYLLSEPSLVDRTLNASVASNVIV